MSTFVFKNSPNSWYWLVHEHTIGYQYLHLNIVVILFAITEYLLCVQCHISIWVNFLFHDDAIKRSIVQVTGLCPVNYTHKGQWLGASMFTFFCAWTNGWGNNRDAGDLRRHRAHYDGTVMCPLLTSICFHVSFNALRNMQCFWWWRHNIKTLSAFLLLCDGIPWMSISKG